MRTAEFNVWCSATSCCIIYELYDSQHSLKAFTFVHMNGIDVQQPPPPTYHPWLEVTPPTQKKGVAWEWGGMNEMEI